MITEISIFLPNEPGILAGFVDLMRENNVNIRGISVAETADYGLLSIIVDKSETCIDLLKENEFDYSAKQVLAVKISDDLKSLFTIANVMGNNDVNIEYLYTTVVNNIQYMVLRVDNLEKGVKVVREEGFDLLEGEQL
ncbi:MAG: ACT domain-containing protein [Candidatus Lokiarchaeota archaeon]|nr:ACT domain-containing protein [Candidatus Lokiarchaeota archaeon]MBD3342789.1 ACT domain-containing protein [Candidatus Lokiarchaeota archaeon]